MAGVPDPLEDMLYSDVDEKAVSDLVGSLESQLGGPGGSAAPQRGGRRSAEPQALTPGSGQTQNTQAERRRAGIRRAAPKLENGSPCSVTTAPDSVLPGAAAVAAGGHLQPLGKGLLTSAKCSSDAAVVAPSSSLSANTPDTLPHTNHISATIRTVLPSESSTVTVNPSAVSSAPTAGAQNSVGATVGVTSVVGSPAAVGTTSVVGSSVAIGTVGTTGAIGAVGLPGSIGAVGAIGSAGSISAPGVIGNTSALASTSAIGSVGSVSAIGAVGSIGAAGVGVAGSSLANENSNMSSSNGTNGPVQSDQMLSQPSDPSGGQTIALHRPLNPVPNGSDPKAATQVVGAASVPVSTVAFPNTNATLVKASPQGQIKTIVPNQLGGSPVGLHPSPPVTVTTPAGGMQASTSLPVASTPSVLVKPEGGLVGQPTALLSPGTAAPVVATVAVSQRPAVPVAPRAVAPQVTVRPQQQTTIQLPPGFTIPQGMVLVRTEAGQLVLVPQQVLAQAKAQSQTQNKPALSPRPATPTTTATFRVTAPVVQAPVSSPTIRPIPPAQAKVVQTLSPTSPALQSPVVTVSSAQKPAGPTVITTGARVPAPPLHVLKPFPSAPAPTVSAPTGTTALSPEMQENVKKCKNFLATLIKLASHNSPSPETSRNVKALVQDLLDTKIEPEEFTSRLQTELKSSPQPYLIPFLKKSLPALRMTLLNSQQSLTQLSQPTSSTPPTAGSVKVTPPPRSVTTTMPPVRPTITQDQTAIKRTGVQGSPARMPVVITQTIRPQGPVVRGPSVQVRGPIGIAVQASANQKQKLNDPGGGTFKDDDDINDVASMAGVNLNEENARILATGSELVGTQIRSCKDETFLQSSLLHKRILEIARTFGVNEVGVDVVSLVSHAAEVRLRSMLENVSALAQHRMDSCKDEERYEQVSDVRTQLKFFEQLERLEKQRKDDEEREILLKVAKSRSRQEDPEQARLKQKAKEMQQQELAQMRQRDANLTALAAIGPRKKRKLDAGASASGEGSGGSLGLAASSSSSSSSSSSRQVRQRITRVNLRDLIFCLEQERSTSRSLLLYKALLK
ncbi:transcription initiation factor TFIID subunit 4 isoform X2 [Hoplias malabaricus]|uniref:transcription initiation factor TFIID subunit 4 isoform X2 n=1 Tax=Hoplias malabaricus TaxID=27720 RepID=UPI003461E479